MKKPPEKKAPECVEYINREVSWLKFDTRVLEEARNEDNPLLERLKFLGIFESNLDEFFMVRVSGLIEQEVGGHTDLTPDGLNPTKQLVLISSAVRTLRAEANKLWTGVLKPELAKNGIVICHPNDLTEKDKKQLREYFRKSVFPLCTPLMLEPNITFPFISNRSLNLAVELFDDGARKLARVKIPPNLSRLVKVESNPEQFVFLEDVVAQNLDLLFPSVQIVSSHRFRVIRDADVEIREIEAADLIAAVEQSLTLRRLGDPVLLEYEPAMDKKWLATLKAGLVLDEPDTVKASDLLGYDALFDIYRLNRPDLKYKPFIPHLEPDLSQAESIFHRLQKSEVVLHHPYDSFRTVEEFVDSAASDPKVIGIKMTLYRVGAESPIVQSLLRAAEAGKQVAAMVELKARFDENNNLVWARALERAGVHVSYGFPDMKVHCKLCLVVRQEDSGIKTYSHLGTGNYNPQTALGYTDFGLLTSDPDICADVSELFNFLTGLSRQETFRRLLVAPINLREGILERIDREIEHHQKFGNGSIIFKLNSLVDPEVIDALYEASRAGIKVKLAIRGVCCLRPKVKGMSENIEVVSIVGRFLEHSRAYYFGNNGDPDLWIGSADMMRRNLDRRIEVLVNVSSSKEIAYLHEKVLLNCFRDTTKAWELQSNGDYKPRRSGEKFDLQTFLMSNPATSPQP